MRDAVPDSSILVQCCCKSCWCQSSLAPPSSPIFTSQHLRSPDAMLIDGVTTKPRLKQAGIDDPPRVRADNEQSAAGRWPQLIPTILVPPWPPDSSSSTSPHHTSAAVACINTELITLWHNNRIFQFESRLSQMQPQSTLHIC